MASHQTDTRFSIITAVRKKDSSRWDEFYAIYKPMLMGYFRKHGTTEGVAQDLTQDVFLKLFEKIGRYDRTRTRFRTWLFTVARNTLIDYLRSEAARHNALNGLADRLANAAPDEQERERLEFERGHHARILQYAFEKVKRKATPRVWNCFEMSVIKGLSGADVAAALGMNTNAVYVNSWRVLQAVKEVCRRYDEDLKHEPNDRMP